MRKAGDVCFSEVFRERGGKCNNILRSSISYPTLVAFVCKVRISYSCFK